MRFNRWIMTELELERVKGELSAASSRLYLRPDRKSCRGRCGIIWTAVQWSTAYLGQQEHQHLIVDLNVRAVQWWQMMNHRTAKW
jgi:hypothetical protein